MSVGEASSGPALERVLGVLVDRLLARRERRGRTLRAVTLSARLLSGGGWRESVVFRQALADASASRWRCRCACCCCRRRPRRWASRSSASARRRASSERCSNEAHAARAARLREAVASCARWPGEDAAMRAVCVDPDSRVPERRVVLTPLLG